MPGGDDLRSANHVIHVLEELLGRALAYWFQPMSEDGVVPFLEQVSERIVILRRITAQDAVEYASAS